LFNAYQQFIRQTLYKVMHPQITSFSGYVNTVLNTTLLIVLLLILISVVALLICGPIVFYKKKITPISYKIYFSGEDELNGKEKKELQKKLVIYKILFALCISLIYIPILLPIVFIIIDIL
jgi:NADH:ubiquinone oxidoreductase subunit 3 (subunit A)